MVSKLVIPIELEELEKIKEGLLVVVQAFSAIVGEVTITIEKSSN